MTFDVIDLFRLDSRVSVSPLKRQNLSLGIGAEDELTSTIIGPANTPDHRMHGISMLESVIQPFQKKHPCSFAGKKSSGVLVQRLALLIFRVGLEDGKTHIDEKGISGTHGSRKHQLGFACIKVMTGKSHGIK